MSAALAAGEKLDRYTIVEAIGHGAFSDVYLATDPDGAQVVLKCPHEGIIGDVATFDRFRREMEIARRLDHPAELSESGIPRGAGGQDLPLRRPRRHRHQRPR